MRRYVFFSLSVSDNTNADCVAGLRDYQCLLHPIHGRLGAVPGYPTHRLLHHGYQRAQRILPERRGRLSNQRCGWPGPYSRSVCETVRDSPS